MVELEVVADVAMKDTSVGGNNCPEYHVLRHVTRVTTSDTELNSACPDHICDRHSQNHCYGVHSHSATWLVSQHENNTELMTQLGL